MGANRAWLAAVMRDFEGTPAAEADVQLIDFDPARAQEFSAVIPDAWSWIDPSSPTEHRLLLKVASSMSSLEPTDNPAVTAVEVASRLQDFVMDETGRPWPLAPAAEGSMVLEPRLSREGSPRWEGHGGHYCAFGELGARLAADRN